MVNLGSRSRQQLKCLQKFKRESPRRPQLASSQRLASNRTKMTKVGGGGNQKGELSHSHGANCPPNLLNPALLSALSFLSFFFGSCEGCLFVLNVFPLFSKNLGIWWGDKSLFLCCFFLGLCQRARKRRTGRFQRSYRENAPPPHPPSKNNKLCRSSLPVEDAHRLNLVNFEEVGMEVQIGGY